MIGQDQSNLLLSNQARTLDGAIFPWLRDTRAFLLLNHLAFFSCIFILLILLVFEKFSRAYLFQIALEIMWLPIQICAGLGYLLMLPTTG